MVDRRQEFLVFHGLHVVQHDHHAFSGGGDRVHQRVDGAFQGASRRDSAAGGHRARDPRAHARRPSPHTTRAGTRSLSPTSSVTQAGAARRAAHHARTAVVFPYPAGAATQGHGPALPRVERHREPPAVRRAPRAVEALRAWPRPAGRSRRRDADQRARTSPPRSNRRGPAVSLRDGGACPVPLHRPAGSSWPMAGSRTPLLPNRRPGVLIMPTRRRPLRQASAVREDPSTLQVDVGASSSARSTRTETSVFAATAAVSRSVGGSPGRPDRRGDRDHGRVGDVRSPVRTRVHRRVRARARARASSRALLAAVPMPRRAATPAPGGRARGDPAPPHREIGRRMAGQRASRSVGQEHFQGDEDEVSSRSA